MPRKPRRRNERALNDHKKWWFVWGTEILTGDPKMGGFKSIDEAKAAWKIHGEDICKEYAEDVPGVRPWAWWRWSHKKGPVDGPVLDPIPVNEW